MQQGVVTVLGVGEEVDKGGHIVVDHERKIGLGGGQFGLCLGYEVGIDREGHVAGYVGRGGLHFGQQSRCPA